MFQRSDAINPILKTLIDGNNSIKNKKHHGIRDTISNIGQN